MDWTEFTICWSPPDDDGGVTIESFEAERLAVDLALFTSKTGENWGINIWNYGDLHGICMN